MLYREIRISGPGSEKAAQIPAVGEARVKRQRTVDQPDHRADVLAEPRQHKGRVGQDLRVALPRRERLPCERDAFAADWLRRVGPAVGDEPQVTDRCPSECRPVMQIDRYCPLEQFERRENSLFRYWK